MRQITEQEIIGLIARDRLEIPLSSMYQKVKKAKKSDAGTLAEKLGSDRFESERVYAYVEQEDRMRARGIKEALEEFSEVYPEHGAILTGMIEEKRIMAEKHLYFGVRVGNRLSTDDYIEVMQSLGLSEQIARKLYPELLNVSRKLMKAREEERTVLVGKYEIEGQS